MIYLLDVSTLLAWLWCNHQHHERVISWKEGKLVAICPISELGFLRISTQPLFGASPAEARRMMTDWRRQAQPTWISCDLSALEGRTPPSGSRTTDFYLADLARKHGMRWATLDEKSRHPRAFLLPP